MKKLLMTVCAGLVGAVVAAPVEIAEIQIADKETLVKAVADFGTMANNPFFGMMLAGSLSQEKIPSVIRVTADSAAVAAIKSEEDLEKLGETLDIETIYASTNSPAPVLKGDLLRATIHFELFPSLPDLKGLSTAKVAVRLDSAGLAMTGDVQIKADSPYAQSYKDALPKGQFFAAVAKDALWASDYAANAGGSQAKAFCLEAIQLVEKYGVQTTNWLVRTETPAAAQLTLDLAALMAYIEAEDEKKTFEKIEPKQFMTEYCALAEKYETAGVEKGPACALSLGLKGFTPKYPIAQRFAKTLPEAAEHPVAAVSLCSVYSMVKAIVPTLVDLAAKEDDVDADDLANAQMILKMLPEEGEGAIASMLWRDGDTFKVMLRVSADEVRSLGSLVTTLSGLVMGAATKARHSFELEDVDFECDACDACDAADDEDDAELEVLELEVDDED